MESDTRQRTWASDEEEPERALNMRQMVRRTKTAQLLLSSRIRYPKPMHNALANSVLRNN